MKIPTTRPGWELKFCPSTAKIGEGKTYSDPQQAVDQANLYRPMLQAGEIVDVVKVDVPIEDRILIQSVITVIRAILGDEFADQVSEIIEDYGSHQFDNGVFAGIESVV